MPTELSARKPVRATTSLFAAGASLQPICSRSAAGCSRFAAAVYANATELGRNGLRGRQRFRAVSPLFGGLRGVF